MSPSSDRLPKSPEYAVSKSSPAPDEKPSVVSETDQEVSAVVSSEPAVEPPTAVDESEPAALEPKRPSLIRPVSRPQPPTPAVASAKPAPAVAASVPDSAVASADPEDSPLSDADSAQIASRMQPIPPPSEPKQYRAIGLVRGRYTPSEEQFTRGAMITADGVEIEAVLLGRVMSLVKNHLDLTQEHLWVVYPRTREAQEALHVQIVGVWEPEKLNRPPSDDESEAVEAESETSESESISPGYEDDYFSIRGEVVFYVPEEKQVVVKIQQAARKASDKPKAFKLKLEGILDSPRTLGYFWELNVKRVAGVLAITDGTAIGLVPPKKRPPSGFRKERRPFKKGAPRSSTGGSKPTAPSGSAPRREPVPKPVKRNDQSSEG